MTLMSKFVGVLLLLLPVAAAANTEFKPGDEVSLKAGNGLLALSVNAPSLTSLIRIDKVGSVFGGFTFDGLNNSHTIRLLEVPPGEYRWTRVDFLGGIKYLNVHDDPRYHFTVEAGVINYPGDFDVSFGGNGRFYLSAPNRTGRFLATFDQHFFGVRHKFAVRYSGPLPDRFAEFATHELGEQSAFEALGVGNSGRIEHPEQDADPPLRPMVEELFARSRVSIARMNPAGDMIATVEFRDGKRRVGLIDAQSQQAVDVYRGDVEIETIQWAGDRTLLVSLDNPNGSSDYVIHVESAAGSAPVFTQMAIPGRGWLIDPLPRDETHAIYGHLESDGAAHIYRIDLRGKQFDPKQFRSELRLDKGLKNAFFGLTDGNGVLRVAMTTLDGDYSLLYRPNEAGSWTEFKRLGADAVFDPLLLSDDGASLVAKTDEGRNQVELVRLGLPSGAAAETLFAEAGADVEGVIVSSFDRRVVGAMVYREGLLQTQYLGKPDERLSAALQRVLPNRNIVIFDTSVDQRHSLLLASDELDPGTFYYYDASANKAQELFAMRGPMPHVHLVRSQLLKVHAADGLPIQAYLTLPATGAPPYPLVVVPHGGPFGVHDRLSFSPEVELLANRGYAVLRTNYRGSGGFGHAFEEAGFGAWGKGIEDDVLAALDAALSQGKIDSARVAIRGASYGGYSALMSLIRSPERLRCGIAVAAVTDIPLMFTSSDWSADKHLRERMMRVVGDPTQALAEMQAVSPDYLYRKLTRPVLLAHGALDARVAPEHMLRLSMLLGHAAVAPQSLFFTQEGHGITDLANRYALEAAADRFLAACTAPVAAN